MGDRINKEKRKARGHEDKLSNSALLPELALLSKPQAILYSFNYLYNTTTLWGIAGIKNVLKYTRDDNSFKER